MKPIQKSFAASSLFPFEIVYKDSKSLQRELPFHYHEWYELIYVYDGEGTFLVDQSIQLMQAGDLFVIPSNIIHRALPSKDNPVTSTAVFFHPVFVQDRFLGDSFHFLQLFETCLQQKSYTYQLDETQQQAVINELDSIQTEITEKKAGYKHATLIHLQKLLLFINREWPRSNPSSTAPLPHTAPGWMNDILSFIETQDLSNLSLSTLAKYGNVSTAHLSRVFKKTTGLKMSEYIMTKKILKAKKMLLGSNLTVEAIARECGFESLPYFHRTFKKYSGLTPSRFRKQHW
ncbi:AraC family transcriptional regulator [Halalkalibacter oceani]|uniref:AraC family transcriptional regulator n=1 Tax=Halalkalibacter oceani TaxID=1653776 RepID=A0A9X2IRR3_9BACI|nr:AraC family transcriptional regulator [Halalkalibacter oceani]MCM3715853.1 AraC family transcriptional regulator [Halalkalibacter oceani]